MCWKECWRAMQGIYNILQIILSKMQISCPCIFFLMNILLDVCLVKTCKLIGIINNKSLTNRLCHEMSMVHLTKC